MDFNKFSCAGFFIVDPSGQFVLLGETEQGYLSPQKGGVEEKKDQSLFDCACRETLEESGIQVSELEFMHQHRFVENAPSGRPNIMYWLAKLKQAKTTFSFDVKELKSVKWYHIETLLMLQSSKLRSQRLAILQDMFPNLLKDIVTKWVPHTGFSAVDKCPLKESCGNATQQPAEVAPAPKNRYTNESRYIVEVLRHHLNEINHDARGYVYVQDFLRFVEVRKLTAKCKKLKTLSLGIIREIVDYDAQYSKQRMDLKQDPKTQEWMIAANQGHSGNSTRTEYSPVLTPFPFLIHGTEQKYQASIAKTGLQKMTRTHIHCIACDPDALNTAKIISGFKKQSDVIVVIDMARTMADGLKWVISENGVVLTEGPIDAKYLTFRDCLPELKS